MARRIVIETRRIVVGLAVWLAATGMALADDAGCAAFKWPVEREQALFASAPPAASGQALSVGEAVAFGLQPVDAVDFSEAPERAPAAGSFGATATLAVKAPLTIQITLSDEAWVDVIQHGAALKPSGFSGVKTCPGIRKSVRFELAAGEAALQFSGARRADLKVAILPAE